MRTPAQYARASAPASSPRAMRKAMTRPPAMASRAMAARRSGSRRREISRPAARRRTPARRCVGWSIRGACESWASSGPASGGGGAPLTAPASDATAPHQRPGQGTPVYTPRMAEGHGIDTEYVGGYPPSMNGVTIYLRRSVVDDDNPGAVSYEQQLRRCRELAKLHGASEPDVLVDWGRSGGEGLEHRRGAYQQLRDGIAMGAVRWVVSYDLSRLSRSTRETLEIVDHAQRHGARVHVGDLGILDPDDPTGTFTLTVLSGANKLTRDMARQRAKEQVMVRRSQGLPIGRPPYGSRPGEDVAAVVAAYTEGGSYHAAARLLNGRGIRG